MSDHARKLQCRHAPDIRNSLAIFDRQQPGRQFHGLCVFVPPALAGYRATLGHKANHADSPNAEYR